MSLLYAWLLFVVGLWATLLSSSNRKVMEEQKKRSPLSIKPLVTIAIPARNEEHNIERCITSLTAQSYTNIEILILDDNSTDHTLKKAENLQALDSRIRIIEGKPLTDGWRGKLYAMQQLYEESKGEFILFTDADTTHNPESLRSGLEILAREQASMVSGYPKQEGESMGVQALLGAMLLNTVLYLPLRLQKKLQHPAFAMAIGQYLLLNRKLLDDIGGFHSIANVICDDVKLARACTRSGHKYIFADMKDALSCTMFPNFKEGFIGLERSIIGVIDIRAYMLPLILLAALILLACAFAPVAIVVMALALAQDPTRSALPFLLTLGGTVMLFGSWARSALYHGFEKKAAFLGPISFILVVTMYLHGLYRKLSGKGFTWKGRTIS